MSLLSVNNLSVSYGAIEAIRNCSLRVEQGEIVTLIGGNGAGKSTMLRTISGLLIPKQGTIQFEGRPETAQVTSIYAADGGSNMMAATTTAVSLSYLMQGGFDALKKAIADIQALGVRVVLFCKFNWAEQSLPDYAEKWRAHAIKDPYGDPYLHQGYRYDTITQMLDINTRRLVPMCFLDEGYLDACVREFDTLLALGADGILYDECLHHMPTLLCFDESHGHRYGAPTYGNDLELIRRFRERLPNGNDFLFAGEAVYDIEFQAYSLSYHRSEERQHLPLHRYTAPREQMSTAATGFDDRNMVNQSLLYRYIVSYEPKNFHGYLHDFPLTVAYGEAMSSLRLNLREWLWEGTFQDTVGATVLTPAGDLHHPYSVFTNSEGVPALVVANYDASAIELSVDLAGPHRWRTIDDPQWHDLKGGRISLAGRSAAVLIPTPNAT